MHKTYTSYEASSILPIVLMGRLLCVACVRYVVRELWQKTSSPRGLIRENVWVESYRRDEWFWNWTTYLLGPRREFSSKRLYCCTNTHVKPEFERARRSLITALARPEYDQLWVWVTAVGVRWSETHRTGGEVVGHNLSTFYGRVIFLATHASHQTLSTCTHHPLKHHFIQQLYVARTLFALVDVCTPSSL